MSFILRKIFKESKAWVHQLITIYVKEVFQIILSPMYSAIVGACCLLWSFTFIRALFTFVNMAGRDPSANIHYSVFISLISQLNLLLVFIVPVLTMKLFAEEKSQHTYDLLLSLPISSTQIVLGKFLAVWKAAGLLVFISSFYIIVTGFFADFHWLMPIMSYIGMFLVVGVYAALSVVASTLTRSAALSVILGIMFNLLLWFISQASSLFETPVLISIMEYLSISDQLFNFARGTLSTSSVLFFIILSSFFIFLSKQIVDTTRWK